MKCLRFFLGITGLGFAMVLDIPVDNIEYQLEDFQGFQRIVLPNGIYYGTPGSPELPMVVYNYLLPQNQRIKEVMVIAEEWSLIPGNFTLFPVQYPKTIDESPAFTEPDSTIYSTANYYPENCIYTFNSGNMRGYKIGQIAVIPFRYNPVLRRLEILKSLKLAINTIDCNWGVSPKRQTALSKTTFEKLFQSIINEEIKGSAPYYSPSFSVEENPQDLSPAELPSLLGPPVDLLIITTEEMLPVYRQFAWLKKILGFNTVIKTLTWIRQHYTGIDDAERIRNFVKEAVEYWGVSFVLLGNDVPIIPTRWVWLEYLMGYFPFCIATDLYFSDLDGNWNYDGDNRLGEVSDSIDFYPDVIVGRIPARNCDDVAGYLSKLHSYLFDPHCPPSGEPPYQRKVFFIGSKLHYDYDAYYISLSLSNHLPQSIFKNYLYEGHLSDFKNKIYEGYNLITFIAHGDVNLMRVHTLPRENVTNFGFDSLTNGIYPLMVVITCYAGPFQEDCLGEHWVMNPSGGGIGFIGPTSSSVASYHQDYTNFLLDSLFALSLGGALSYSKIPLIPPSQISYNWHRIYQFSLNLLGDPTLMLWRDMPEFINSVNIYPDTVCVGIETVTVQITPPLDSFVVVLYKENELFIKETGYAGYCQAIIKTKSTGFLKYTILAPTRISYIDSIYVKLASSYLVYFNHTIYDTIGNGNGIVNPGERIFLRVSLANNGTETANGISVTLGTQDSFITILNDTSGYPIIDPGEHAENLTPFYFFTKNSIPDAHPIIFNLQIKYSGTYNYDTFQIIPQAPRLSLFTQRANNNGDTIGILCYIENRGSCIADSVVARISSYSDTVLVLDSIANFLNIQAHSITPAVDSFKLFLNYPGSVLYNFRLYYRGIEVINNKIKLATPPQPDSLISFGMPNSIALSWKPITSAIGYRIYRAVNQSGPYQFLKNNLEPICYFEDYNVQPGIHYYYYLCGVDSSMNEGINSDTVQAMTNPIVAQGWPRTVYGYLFSSANFGELDPSYPGLEIVVCGKEGSVYAWHYDGTPLAGSLDGRIFQGNGEIWSSPAVGDVNLDGKSEICFGIRRSADNLYVLTKNDTTWIPLSGWPKSLPGGVLTSPVLSDIDNDGDLEIFVISEWGMLYAFHHTGAGVFSPDGLLKELYGSHRGSPAIGDINGDGNLEIVVCGGSESDSLFVWDRYGNYLTPFPIRVIPNMSFSPVLGDVTGDGNLEICFYTDSTNFVHLVDANGNILWQNHIPLLGDVEAYPVFANITGNERPEIICGSNQGYEVLCVFDSLGNMISGFPPQFGHDFKLPIGADINGDDSMDILCGAGDWNLYAFQNDGSLVTGFPIHFGIRIEQSPAVFDIDMDGKLELMVGANDYKFWVFNLNSRNFDWPRFRYDQYNTGCYKSENLPGGVIIHRALANSYSQLLVCPNPFLEKTEIRYEIRDMGRYMSVYPISHISHLPSASIKIYDITGRLVRSFSPLTVNNKRSTIIWDGTDNWGRHLPAGVYFVRLEAWGLSKVKKAVLIK
ncbi:MAG: C25 family cysteine peptidase [candidate division WOR-3 bacterium]